MFCPNCGASLPEGAKFCGSCGSPVPETEPIAEAPTPEETTPPVITEEKIPAPVQPEEQPVTDTVQAVEEAAPVTEAVKTAEEAVTAEAAQTAEEAVTAEAAQTAEEAAPVTEAVRTAEEAVTAEAVQTVEETTPAEAAQTAEIKSDPLDFTPLMAAPLEQPKKKKSKKGLIIGLSAAAVVLAGGAVGYFCFHDDITRLIMGNEGYSKMIEERSYSDYIGIKNMGEEKLDLMLSKQIDTAAAAQGGGNSSLNSGDLSAIGVLLSESKEEFTKALNGNNALSFDVSGEIHIGDELLDFINAGMKGDIAFSSYIDFLNSLKYSGSVAVGDVSEAVFSIACESGSYLTCEIISDKDGNTVVGLPEISDKYFRIKGNKTEKPEVKETKKLSPFGEAQIKRLREKFSEIYLKYFEKGNITVTKDYELKKGDITVKGTAIISEFDSVLINNFMTELSDFLYNDEYVKGYFTGTLGMEQGDFAKLFESDKKINGGYKVINVVDKHNNVIGKRIELTDDDTEGKTEIELLRQDKDTALFYADKKEKFLLKNTATDDKSGKANLKIYTKLGDSSLTAQALSIDIIYSDLEKTEIFGQEVNTGSVTVKIADDDTLIKGTLGLFSAFGSIKNGSENKDDVSNKLMLSNENSITNSGSNATKSDDILKALIDALAETEINVTLKKEGEGLNVQYSLSLGELLSFKTTAAATALMKTVEMPEAGKIFDMEDEETELKTALLERVKEFAEKDPYFGKIVNANDINDQIKEIEEEANFKKNYADFSKYGSVRHAENLAENIYEIIDDALTDLLVENGAESGGVIKLYFDKEGNIEVIDSAGFDKTDFSALFGKIANNCYAEITLDWRHIAGLGVTAVLTDDKNNIPDNLPKWYNYQDKVYDWEDEEDYIGFFVAGTYPELSEGVSTAEGNYINLDKDIKTLEGYAKTVGRFTENYLKAKDYTVTPLNDYVSLVLERNTAGWQAAAANTGIWEDDIDKVFDESFLAQYLDALNKNTAISAISEDVRIELFFDNTEDDTIKKPWFVGVGVNYVKDNDKLVQYGKPQCDDYINGYFSWTGKEYLWDGAQSGYYLGAGGVVLPFGTYSATTGDVLIPNNLYPADYILENDIVSTYYYSQSDPFNINGAWTLTSIDGIPLEQYAKEKGYKLSELQKNLIIYGDEIEVEDINGYNNYPITNDADGFRLHYDEARFSDFIVNSEDRTLSYEGLINGRDIVTFRFTEGYNIIDNPELYQGDFDIASLAGTWILTKIGGVSTSEMEGVEADYTIEIGTDGSVKVCGDGGYKAIPTYTGFKIYLENINYAIWELNYDLNTDTLTDSVNGENEIYLFERKQ